MNYDRYKFTRKDGISYTPPFTTIDERDSDKYERYMIGVSRLDKISYNYYNDPKYGFVILMANPEYSSEFDIPDNSVIRIPYPLNEILNEIDFKIQEDLKL